MATTSNAPVVNGAYVHLLTNDAYLPGLLVLHRSYVKVGDIYPFVVMVTPTVSSEVRHILQQSGMVVRPVKPIKPQCRLEKGDARFMDTWTKLRAFELFEYERVVLRDIDMLLLQNMDDLFELDLPPGFIAATHVCACNPRGFPHYPQDWFPANCPYTCLTYPSCLSHAAPITSSSPRPYSLLNSGVVVLTPSPENARQVSSFLHTSPLIPTFKFPDQDFLAELFRDRWLPLPWVYNALKSLRYVHPEIWRDEDIRCLHYIYAEKPWLVPRPCAEPESLVAPPSPAGSSAASISPSDDALSFDGDTRSSTPVTSPAMSQLDIGLTDTDERESLVDSKRIGPAELDLHRHPYALNRPYLRPLCMTESDDELARWWWAAFDQLEIELGNEPWWALVEANVNRRPGADF